MNLAVLSLSGGVFSHTHVILCAIWYHLYNLKNVKKQSWRGFTLVPPTLLKVILFHGCFSRFLNCTNGTKSRKVSNI